MKVRYIILFLVGLSIAVTSYAQVGRVPSAAMQAQVKKELSSQGVDEQELRTKLRERGLDVDNMSRQELLASRSTIRDAVEEIKAQQNEATSDQEANRAAREIDKMRDKDEVDSKRLTAGDSNVGESQLKPDPVENDVESLDRINRVYGHQLFNGKKLEIYEGSTEASAPNNYILDSGDELAVSIFGVSQADLLLTVGNDGFVRPPGTPKIYIRGRSLGDARELIYSRLSNYYIFTEGQFSLTLDGARTVSISIYGEVRQGGTYSLSALNGPLNALLAAGGPTEQGSVRNIELIREGETQLLDVYEFLSGPGQTRTYALRNNDVLNVPLAQEVVRIRGGVRRPMLYELKRDEMLADLVEYAGGTLARASLNATRVERYTNGSVSIINVEPKEYARYNLYDGDVVEIPIVDEPIQNFVSIEGEVLINGKFGINQNTTIQDLLNRAQVKPGARKDVAFLQRRDSLNGTLRLDRISLITGSPDLSMALKRGDAVTVLSAERFMDDATFTVAGAIRDSSRTLPYPKDGKLTVDEAVLLGGGLLDNAIGEVLIIRTPTANTEERKYMRIPIQEMGTIQVEPFDLIVVYEQERFADEPTVSISGAVRNSLSVRFDKSLSLNDLIYLAGGVSFNAALNRVEVYRLSLDGNATETLVERLSLNDDGISESNFSLKAYDKVYVRSSADFEAITSVAVLGEVRFPGTYARLKGQNKVSDFIARAGGLTGDSFAAGTTLYRNEPSIGFVVLELDEILKDVDKPENIVLRPGDTIRVPKPQELVTIYTEGTNAVRYGVDSTGEDGTIQVAYQGPHDAGWYIENYAGGFDRKVAKSSRTTVRYPAGGVRETRDIIGIRTFPEVKPGSSIRPGLKPPKKPKLPREPGSWEDIAQVIMAGLTATLTTILIIDRF